MLLVLFSVGLVGHAMPSAEGLMLRLTPVFMLLTGVLVTMPSLVLGRWQFPVWMAATYVFTFLVEGAGARTGAIFGSYQYGPTLGLGWHGVPFLIGLNWVLVANGAACLAAKRLPARAGPWRRPAVTLLAALLAVVFDFIMEPVAIRNDYWHWAGDVIPLQNYVAWFVVAAGVIWFHPVHHRPDAVGSGCAGKLAGFFFLLLAVYFCLLRLVWHLVQG